MLLLDPIILSQTTIDGQLNSSKPCGMANFAHLLREHLGSLAGGLHPQQGMKKILVEQ